MALLEIGTLLLVVASGTLLVFTRDVASQPIVLCFFGLTLALMFFVFQAPDVALSQIVVGAVGLPLMVLLAIAKLRRDEQVLRRERTEQRAEQRK